MISTGDRYLRSFQQGALVFCLVAVLGVAHAADAWPPAGSDPALRAMIDAAGYDAEESRNVMTALKLLSEPKGFDTPQHGRYFCERYHTIGPPAYYILDRAYGKRDAVTADSLKNPARVVKDILAKGNRLWLYVETTAIHAGPLYGVPATSKPITLYETMWLRFDEDGKICESTLIAQQGELYRELGGHLTFPGKPDDAAK
jgi:hypothetical protein